MGWPFKYLKAPTQFSKIERYSLTKNFEFLPGRTKHLRISFLGDFMGIGEHKITLDKSLLKVLNRSDIIMINLECVIHNGKGPILSKQYTSLDSFKHLCSQLDMKKVVFGVANNHLNDFGEKGVEQTLNEISKAGARYVGTQERPKLYLKKGLAIEAATFWYSKQDRVTNKSFTASTKDEQLIHFLHWGEEFSMAPSRAQNMLARKLGESSLALIGHHSHCPQPIKNINGMVSAFSLGNFCTSFKSPKINSGIITSIDLSKSDKWEVISGSWRNINMEIASQKILIKAQELM